MLKKLETALERTMFNSRWLLAPFYIGLVGAVFLLLVNIVLLIIGCVMEVGVAIIILVPILSPVATQFGIDPLHFAMIVVVNLCIGLITPPVGVVLFVACGISGESMESITKAIWPFLFAIVAVLILVTYLPAFTVTLPKLFGLAV